MTRLAYRPVVCGDNAVLPPVTGGVPVSMPLHYNLLFRGMAFHPDRPSMAICQLSMLTRPVGGDALPMAVVIDADNLRHIAHKMLAIADELDIKPARASVR